MNFVLCFLLSGQAGRIQGGKSPLDYLQVAAVNLALAMKQSPKQASHHFQLGLVLEEHYYAQDMFGYKTEVRAAVSEPR